MALWSRLRSRSPEEKALDRWSDAVVTLLEPLEKTSPGLPVQVRDYAMTGAPVGVLASIGQSSGWEVAAALVRVHGGRAEHVLAVAGRLGDLPPDVVVRWGKVLEAALRSGFDRAGLAPVAGGRWVGALLQQIQAAWADVDEGPSSIPLDVGLLGGALAAERATLADLLVAAFSEPTGPSYLGTGDARRALRRMQGYSDAVGTHAAILRPVVTSGNAKGRLTALEMLDLTEDVTLHAFAHEVADLVTSSSTQVRKAARPLAERLGASLAEPLRNLALRAAPEQRLHAYALLRTVAPDDATTAWAAERAAQDRAPAVRALAESWLRRPEPDDEPEVNLVERPVIEWRVEVTPSLHTQLVRLWTECNEAIDAGNRTSAAHAKAYEEHTGVKRQWPRPDRPLEQSRLRRLETALHSGTASTGSPAELPHSAKGAVVRWLGQVDLSGPGVFIVLSHLGVLRSGEDPFLWPVVPTLHAIHERDGHPTLLELATMLDELGYDGGRVVLNQYAHAYRPLGRHWPDAEVAPFVTQHLGVVLELLRSTERSWSIDPHAPYRALATLPSLPRGVVDELFAIALAGPKADRRPAQDALASAPGGVSRVAVGLSDGKGDVRAEAARWLARLADESSVPALEAAVAKEKQDVAKAAMLDALEVLGRPVERYLDRDTLEAQAVKAMAKGLPKELSWVRWDAVPEVRWADTGEPVARTTVQWLVAQSVKARSAEPNAILRRYCTMFEPRGREALGQWLLEAWLAEDVRPIAPDEARRRAQQEATQTLSWIQSYPQSYTDHPLATATPEQALAYYLPRHLRQPAGSVISSRGLLAVVAACAGERAAAPVGRYLREWYGSRAAQGKALIVMLAWIDHPSATQLVLAVASRFRTKSFQQEAARQAEALAERKGWTLVELADRTMPTAGLDETGTLELSYGDRRFTAVLAPDFSLLLHSPDGQRIKALPAPRQTDDADRAAEAKKTLTAARKELKTIVAGQTARLYEAMCTQREWTYEDWDRYLAMHPVVGRLTQGLVWVARTPDGDVLFRPLEDRTLTDVDDGQVVLPSDARVALAHATTVEPEVAAAWQQHLADYEVAAVFPQLSRDVYRVPDDKADATEITDVRGHLIETFTLRGKATKLGWSRGAVEDGAWFFTYEKAFGGIDLVTAIEFTGTWLPEENRTVALLGLSVQSTLPDGSTSPVRLKEVPPVLLAEVHSDLTSIAAAGSGFEPDWEKVTAP